MLDLNDRQREIVAELNASIEKLALALDGDDPTAAASAAREVEVESMHLRLTLRGGKRLG